MEAKVHQAGDPVIRLFQAMANPARASILHRLTEGECGVTEMVDFLGLSQPLVSHHLQTLRQAHLVESRREGKRMVYSLVDEHVAHIFLDAVNHMKEHQHDCEH